MAKRHSIFLTEEEIRHAMAELSDTDDNEAELEDNQSDCSESGVNAAEINSDVDDELSLSSGDEYVAEEGVDPTIYLGKDGMEWRSTPYSQQHSAHLIREDIHTVRLPPGKHIDCTLDAFSLFFDKEITDMIVKYTNIEGQRVAADKWKRTDPIEVRAFIGLVINAGLKKGGIKIDVNNKNKSTINTFYNTTKVGVNLLDQMAQSFTARRKTNRWPNVLFYNLVDDMVVPHIQRRSIRHLSKHAVAGINDVLDHTSASMDVKTQTDDTGMGNIFILTF
uniref:PiggyBac transposable element-derived protein domain-containing protein n=1 Tax=Glossina palpalis gambiensis TaxID=67801 RepID=A0A1B0AYY6_9MUSC